MQMEARIVRIEVFTIEMRADGILHLHADGDKVITMELYRKMVNAIGEMTGGRKVPILCTTDELTMPDDEVKEFMVKPDANPYSSANALIAPSLPQKIFSNLFIRILKPARPVRMFRNREDAIEWLKSYL
jgi:hypothetical protein